jgi:hypothetical protein
MLKKEFKEVFKQMLYFLLIIFLILCAEFIERVISKSTFLFFDSFFPIFQFGILFMAFFFGISLFSSEVRQKGTEYILSFPYSRLKLLCIKVAPRAIAMILFYLLYILFYYLGGKNISIIAIVSFSYLFFALFLISISFSSVRENFLVNAITVLFVFSGFLALVYAVYSIAHVLKGYSLFCFPFKYIFIAGIYFIEPKFIFFVILFLVLPFVISFILAFRKFDVRSCSIFNKRYMKLFIPTFLAGLIISIFFAYSGTHNPYRSYYLTGNHKLIETNYFNTRIYDHNSLIKLKESIEPYFWCSVENEKHIYMYDWSKKDGYRVQRFNKINNHIETIYTASKKNRLSWKLHEYKDTIILFERKKGERPYSTNIDKVPSLILINTVTKSINKVKPKFQNKWKHLSSILFGVYETANERLWLKYFRAGKNLYQIVKINKHGNVEEIGKSENPPLYVNNILITTDEQGIIFESLTQSENKIIKRIPEKRNIRFQSQWFMSKNLNNEKKRFIYGSVWDMKKKKRKKLVVMDLENFKIKDIKTDFELDGNLRVFNSGIAYFTQVDFKNDLVKALYKIDGEKIKLLKRFKDVKRFGGPFPSFEIFRSGIIIRKKGKVSVFTLPDLKELKFKKL